MLSSPILSPLALFVERFTLTPFEEWKKANESLPVSLVSSPPLKVSFPLPPSIISFPFEP